MKPIDSGLAPRILSGGQAIPTDFPENEDWRLSSGGPQPPVFRDGGSKTFPKTGLLGKVGGGNAPRPGHAGGEKEHQKFRGVERGTPIRAKRRSVTGRAA